MKTRRVIEAIVGSQVGGCCGPAPAQKQEKVETAQNSCCDPTPAPKVEKKQPISWGCCG